MFVNKKVKVFWKIFDEWRDRFYWLKRKDIKVLGDIDILVLLK